jgi:hypothetical protein
LGTGEGIVCTTVYNSYNLQVHSDFVAAATRGAMAVIDGNVMAINPGEEAKMQMFIWNNIFFSLGFDVRDHYKELGGDAAAFIAPVSNSEYSFSPHVFNQKRLALSADQFLWNSE